MAYISVDRKHANTKPKYIAGMGWNFGWEEDELAILTQGWNKGLPLWDLANEVGRIQEETAILLMDYGKIKSRPGWLYGTEWGRR